MSVSNIEKGLFNLQSSLNNIVQGLKYNVYYLYHFFKAILFMENV